MIDDPDFTVLGLQFDDILDGIDLIQRYNLNSADASSLRAFLKYVSLLSSPGASVVVASDQRLLRAASGEGFAVLNLEQVAAADVPAFLASL